MMVAQTLQVSDGYLRHIFADGSRLELAGGGWGGPGFLSRRRTWTATLTDASGTTVDVDEVRGPVDDGTFGALKAFAAWCGFGQAAAEAADHADRRRSETTVDGEEITAWHRWCQEHDSDLADRVCEMAADGVI